tara:strand:- start:292 stop:783 length:492 start_codon:yes stop_codon:yes gene_type:complete
MAGRWFDAAGLEDAMIDGATTEGARRVAMEYAALVAEMAAAPDPAMAVKAAAPAVVEVPLPSPPAPPPPLSFQQWAEERAASYRVANSANSRSTLSGLERGGSLGGRNKTPQAELVLAAAAAAAAALQEQIEQVEAQQLQPPQPPAVPSTATIAPPTTKLRAR